MPGGGPSPDGTRWIACRPNFFLPVRVLSRLYRRLFLQALHAAFDAGVLRFFGENADLADPKAFARLLIAANRMPKLLHRRRLWGQLNATRSSLCGQSNTLPLSPFLATGKAGVFCS